MKKLGVSLFLLGTVCAAVLACLFSQGGVLLSLGQTHDSSVTAHAETSARFPARYYNFEKFSYSKGIFIMRDNNAVYDKTDVFTADIFVNEDSNMFRINGDGTRTDFKAFRYEAVVFEKGAWNPTNLFTVDPAQSAVVWTLPKRTPAGLYGVRVTALEPKTDENGIIQFDDVLDENGVPMLDAQGNKVKGDITMIDATDSKLVDPTYPDVNLADPLDPSSGYVTSKADGIYVILYGDELKYINITDEAGDTVYDARAAGASRQIRLDVNINGGAMIRTGLVESSFPAEDPSVMGNLTLFASVLLNPSVVEVRYEDEFKQPLATPELKRAVEVRVEDLYGNPVSPDVINATVYHSHIDITLSENLPANKFLIKLIDPRSSDVYGVYVVDNIGEDTFSSIWGGSFCVTVGLLMLAGAVVMFVWPRVAVFTHERKYKKIERNIEEGQREDKKWKAQTAKDSYKNAVQRKDEAVEEIKNLDVSQQTKGESFLARMAEGRMRREIARNAGLTMDEFRELEEKQKKTDAAHKSSLSEFRKMVEEQTGTKTDDSEGESEGADRNSEFGEIKDNTAEDNWGKKDDSESEPSKKEDEDTGKGIESSWTEDGPKSMGGGVEFEPLDSIGKSDEMDEELREQIFGKHKPASDGGES